MARHAWGEAYDVLVAADRDAPLAQADLELLAEAAWWTGRLPDAIEARERAFAASTRAGDVPAAVLAAIGLARDNLFRNSLSVAAAWLSRAEHLLAPLPEGIGHGWLASTRAFLAALGGDYETTVAEGRRALDIALRVGDPNLEAMARSETGVGLIHSGKVDEGMAMIDEATVSAVAGEIEPAVAGGICCATIEACASLGDWRRVAQWTEAQDRWCRREQINGFPGMCRVFRAEVKRMQGSWLEAEAEARRAVDELPGWIPAAVGLAMYEIAMIRLRRGDLPAAEEALRQAHAYGRDPEPGMSLLRLAQGRTDAAREGIRRAIEEPPDEPSWAGAPGSAINRLALLPAQVEIAVATGDVATARVAADELSTMAETYRSDTTRAAAATARGAVLAAEGDAGGATRELRAAVKAWTEMDARYDAARARRALAGVLAADGAPEAAVMELQAAREQFAQVGATPDVEDVDAALAAMGVEDIVAADAGRRATRAFCFTDIVESTRLASLLGDAAWSELLRWHDQTIRSLVAEHGGEEIKRTGDGFFLAFASARAAVECAIAIQRRLAAHRREHGFAPEVRIGMHEAEATRSGLDYIGTGVNVAARIAAAAEGGEILASAESLRGMPGVAIAKARTLELKGVDEPVDAVAVDWG